MHKYLSYIKYAPHILLIIIMLAAWHGWQNRQEYALHFITPAEPEEVIKLPTVREACVPVVHYVKADAIKENIVPEHIKKDDTKQVTAAIEVPPHGADTLVTSVMDISSGINTLSYRQHAIPLFAFLSEKEIGFRYGLNGASGMGFDIYGQWTFLRVGSIFSSLYLEGNSNSQFKAMVMAGYRF